MLFSGGSFPIVSCFVVAVMVLVVHQHPSPSSCLLLPAVAAAASAAQQHAETRTRAATAAGGRGAGGAGGVLLPATEGGAPRGGGGGGGGSGGSGGSSTNNGQRNNKNWLKRLPGTIWTESRRRLNFGSMLGSPLTISETPYDRVAGHPVFSVTTSWGSPYMNMERLADMDEIVKEPTTAENLLVAGATDASGKKKKTMAAPTSISEEQNEYRTVVLFYLDPDDALAAHGEMKQMENMDGADLRLTCFSLSKALRQAANLGNGLVTGMQDNIDGVTGEVKPPAEGGSLRYKLVPPKRQLYYAARCVGRERVGLFGETPGEDAQAAVLGNPALEGANIRRRREKRGERNIAGTGASRSKDTTVPMATVKHMEGYTGIPVFYLPSLRRVLPPGKRIATGVHYEIPLFFDYEDMAAAWRTMRRRTGTKKRSEIPEEPPDAEVFNLWDVLTSMDKNGWGKKKKQQQQGSATPWYKKNPFVPVKNRLWPTTTADNEGLEHITFVPSSRSVQYKESVSSRGNGKARLRPMRAWGRYG